MALLLLVSLAHSWQTRPCCHLVAWPHALPAERCAAACPLPAGLIPATPEEAVWFRSGVIPPAGQYGECCCVQARQLQWPDSHQPAARHAASLGLAVQHPIGKMAGFVAYRKSAVRHTECQAALPNDVALLMVLLPCPAPPPPQASTGWTPTACSGLRPSS